MDPQGFWTLVSIFGLVCAISCYWGIQALTTNSYHTGYDIVALLLRTMLWLGLAVSVLLTGIAISAAVVL